MKNDAIQKENRKALPLFLAILAVALVIGFFCGWLMVEHGGDLSTAVSGALNTLLTAVTPWAILVCSLIAVPVCIWLLHSCKKMLAAWDGEDEAITSRMETRASFVLIITSFLLLVGFFFMSSAYVYLQGMAMLWVCGQFLAVMAATIILQQKTVDFEKSLNPEKRGSIYDTKFQKKWLESCDEAERSYIYKASHQSMKATTMAFLILWVILTVGSFSFDYGLLPSAVVLLIWGVQQAAYFIACTKLEKGSNSSRIAS